jgi:hypothetical protein
MSASLLEPVNEHVADIEAEKTNRGSELNVTRRI